MMKPHTAVALALLIVAVALAARALDRLDLDDEWTWEPVHA